MSDKLKESIEGVDQAARLVVKNLHVRFESTEPDTTKWCAFGTLPKSLMSSEVTISILYSGLLQILT